MNNQIGPWVKDAWNVVKHVLHNYFGTYMITTAYSLGRYLPTILHLFVLKMHWLFSRMWWTTRLALWSNMQGTLSSICCIINLSWYICYIYCLGRYLHKSLISFNIRSIDHHRPEFFRSAVLAQKGENVAALRDIGRALATKSYPEQLQVTETGLDPV